MSNQKVAVITGSSSGIGLLTAIEFAQNGYLVVATMRDLGRSDRLEEAAQTSRGGRENSTSAASTSPSSIPSPAAIDSIAHDHGRIDVLVNNAGFSVAGFGEDLLARRNTSSV